MNGGFERRSTRAFDLAFKVPEHTRVVDPNCRSYKDILGLKKSDIPLVDQVTISQGDSPTKFPTRIFNIFVHHGWFKDSVHELPLKEILPLTPNQLLHDMGPYVKGNTGIGFGKVDLSIIEYTLFRILKPLLPR